MSVDASHKLGLAIDPAALQAMKTQSRNAPDAALKSVAKQFEGVFLNMMLKSMRDTVPQEGLGNSQQTKMFQGMLDEQYASALSQGRGLGLADMIVRQFKSNSQGAISNMNASASLNAVGDLSAAASTGTDIGLSSESAPISLQPVSLPSGNLLTDPSTGSAVVSPSNPNTSSLPAVFKAQMSDFAASASQTSGIPANFLLAQAGLESGWGKHQPLMPNGSPSYNLFGIKAGPNWHGASVNAITTEVVNGTPQKVVQSFRAYGSYDEAFHDYAALLSGSARYSQALSANTAKDFAGALQKAGYATDPQYAQKIQKAIRLTGGVTA